MNYVQNSLKSYDQQFISFNDMGRIIRNSNYYSAFIGAIKLMGKWSEQDIRRD